MDMQRAVRASLAVSAPFNLLAAWILFAPAGALGQWLGLPAEVSAIHAALLAYLVALFGLMYAWMATQSTPVRPLLAISALGKLGVFVIVFALWLGGDVTLRLVGLASGDLAFATLWAVYLFRTPSASSAARAPSARPSSAG